VLVITNNKAIIQDIKRLVKRKIESIPLGIVYDWWRYIRDGIKGKIIIFTRSKTFPLCIGKLKKTRKSGRIK